LIKYVAYYHSLYSGQLEIRVSAELEVLIEANAYAKGGVLKKRDYTVLET